MKTSHSAFAGFPRDEFTTLPETTDRLLATALTDDVDAIATPTSNSAPIFRTRPDDAARSVRGARQPVGAAHALRDGRSRARQHRRRRAASRLEMPNRHHLPIDLTRFGLENRNEMFVATEEPHGLIKATPLVALSSWRRDLIRSERVVLPDGVRPATIRVDDGRSRRSAHQAPPGTRRHLRRTLIDAGSTVVMPGLVDTHVHINDPGRADWEGFETATRAAAAGGVTTLVDMPLNSIPVDDDGRGARGEATRRGRAAVMSTSASGAASCPGNAGDIEPLARAGVLGFKCFLSPSGVDEFDHVSEADLREAMPIIAADRACRCWCTRNCRRCCASPIRAPIRAATRRGCDSRPAAAEQAAIDLLIELCRRKRRRACTSCTSPRPTRSHRSTERAPGACRSPSKPVRTT